MTATAVGGPRNRSWLRVIPGAIIAAAIAMLCAPIAKFAGIPAPIIAVALGMTVGAAPNGEVLRPGFRLWAKPGLKVGVALLGAQVSWASLMALGLPAVLAGGGIVLAGVSAGAIIGTVAGLTLVEALIAACAVSICGASAAMAASSALPDTEQSRRTTTLVVVGVNLLSTLAMIIYPTLTRLAGFDDHQAGIFLGLSIHDVAQVAGAGAAVSPEAASTAALAKLSRVLWLGPAVLLAAAILARLGLEIAKGRSPTLAPPAFVVGFAVLVVMRSLSLLPPPLLETMGFASRMLLLGGVAAITAQVSPREIFKLQSPLLITLIATTLVVGLLAAAVAFWLAA